MNSYISITKTSGVYNLKIKQPNGRYSDASEEDILACAQQILTRKLFDGPVMDSANVVKDYLRAMYRRTEYEVLSLILLSSKHQVIEHVELFRRTIDGANVYPREIIREVIQNNAAAVIIAHNHPSGSSEISHADIAVTDKIKNALTANDVRLLDHIIVADSTVSLADRGRL